MSIKDGRDLILRADQAAQVTIKDWIRRALRESFLQALKQAWNIRYSQASTASHRSSSPSEVITERNAADKDKIQVRLSLSGVNSCFFFVERVSRAWQSQLKEECHERVAQWVAEVYHKGKPNLWTEPVIIDDGDSSDNIFLQTSHIIEPPRKHQCEKKNSAVNRDIDTVCSYDSKKEHTTQVSQKLPGDNIGVSTQIASNGDEEKLSSATSQKGDCYHPNAYCKLRALGLKRKLDSPVLSIPDALQEIKRFNRDHPTYWPLHNDIIDQACVDMSRRMRARDKHGGTCKTVRFKVLPKSVWETKKQQEKFQKQEIDSSKPVDESDICNGSDNSQRIKFFTQEDDLESKVETALLASMKKRKSSGRIALGAARKKARLLMQQETSRAPFDAPLSSDGKIQVVLSQEETKVLDSLLILDNVEQDRTKSEPGTMATEEVTIGFFGGLQQVGRLNHLLGSGLGCAFMAKNADKATRRREKISIQERLDPNRIQIGRAENSERTKSKLLRTEDWFDEREKFFDFDLGWCLLEITTQGGGKRLCAFSSMEICLGDHN